MISYISHQPSVSPQGSQEVPKNLITLPWYQRFRLKLVFLGLAMVSVALSSCEKKTKKEQALLDMNQRIDSLDIGNHSDLVRYEWEDQEKYFLLQSSLKQSYVGFSRIPRLVDTENLLDAKRNVNDVSANVYFEARRKNPSFPNEKDFSFIGFDPKNNRVISVTGDEENIRTSVLLTATGADKKKAFFEMNYRIDQAEANKKMNK